MEDQTVDLQSGTDGGSEPTPTSSDHILAAKKIVMELQRLLAEGQGRLAEISATATEALAAQTKVVDLQAVIATKSQHIQDAQEHADKVRADLDRELTAAKQHVTAVEAEKSKAETASGSISDLVSEMKETKASMDVEAATIEKARKTAEESAAVSKALADKSSEVEARIARYEEQLEGLREESAEQLKRITDLLPGATTAGLAHAFDARRKKFQLPQKMWQLTFVGALVVLIGFATYTLWHLLDPKEVTALGIKDVLRILLIRLPVAGPLVWLALYASHEAHLAKRVEEDYAFKGAIASSFEGFKKQMTEVGSVNDTPLAKLLDNTLRTIADEPGRIYEKNPPKTPVDEIKTMVETLGEVVNTLKSKV